MLNILRTLWFCSLTIRYELHYSTTQRWSVPVLKVLAQKSLSTKEHNHQYRDTEQRRRIILFYVTLTKGQLLRDLHCFSLGVPTGTTWGDSYAVVHRDYSLTGKDVKSGYLWWWWKLPVRGLLLPSIDYAAMECRQSDARNKVIAPYFSNVLVSLTNGVMAWSWLPMKWKSTWNIDELRWREVGLSFQVQFVKLDYLKKARAGWTDQARVAKSCSKVTARVAARVAENDFIFRGTTL